MKWFYKLIGRKTKEEGIPRPRWVLRTYEKDDDGNLGRVIKEVITPMEDVTATKELDDKIR